MKRGARVEIGRFSFWLWAGSWSRPGPLDCDCCEWNYYIGPFGFEMDEM